MGRNVEVSGRQAAAGVRLLLLVGATLGCGACVEATAEDTEFIAVRNGKRLTSGQIACRRVAVGIVDDYKPSIALLPDGEILLCMFSGRRLEDGKVAEQTVLYRSADGGKTWAERETPDSA